MASKEALSQKNRLQGTAGEGSGRIPAFARKPVYLLFLLLTVIFTAELITMLILKLSGLNATFQVAALDSLILLIILLPFLFALIITPLRLYVLDRNAYEVKLVAEKTFSDSLINSQPGIFYLFTQEGEFVRWNNNMEDVSGYTSEEILEMSPVDFFEDGEKSKVAEAIAQVFREGKAEVGAKLRTKTGVGIPYYFSGFLMKIDGIEYVIGSGVNISSQKQIEHRLMLAHEEWEKTFDSIPDLISIIDTDHRIVKVNKAVAERLGMKREEIYGRTCFDVFHNTDSPPSYCPHIGSVDGRTEVVQEIYEEQMGGHYLLSSTPLLDEDGNVTGVLEVARDITEQKKAETALAKIHNLESIGVLAGGIAHDFNNLLTAIIGNIQLAKLLVEPDSKVAQVLSSSDIATQTARDLAVRLLTFAKGGLPIKEQLNIVPLIAEVLSEYDIKKSYHINTSFFADTWCVTADSSQMVQLLHNVFSNAEEAMPQGGDITVEVENIGLEDDAEFLSQHEIIPIKKNDYVKITVTDTGQGVDKEIIKRVFDPYFSTKEKSSEKGTGLGLSICYSIVKHHGGYIFLDSPENGGTVVTIYLKREEFAAS